MTDFATAIQHPDLHVRFYLLIEGIPYVFLDGEVPIRPDGAAWSAPTSGSQNYTLLSHTLDVSDGIVDIGPEIDRWTGLAEVGAMTITLADDAQSNLLSIFARNKSDGAVAYLSDDVEWDTAFDGSVFNVDTTGDFTADGLGYFGLETFYYPSKTSNTLGQSGDRAERNLFDLEAGGGTRYGERGYTYNAAKPEGPPRVTDYPEVWRNRRVSLVAFIVDQDGYSYDFSFSIYNSYSREIWRGVIRKPPRPRDDWHRWQLECEDISSLLHTEVGHGEKLPRGMLLRFPGGLQNNLDGWGNNAFAQGFDPETDSNPVPESGTVYYLDDNTRFLSFELFEYDTQADFDNGVTLNVYRYNKAKGSRLEIVSSPQMLTVTELNARFGEVIATKLQDDEMIPDVTAWLFGKSNTTSTVHVQNNGSNNYWTFRFDWTDAGSIGGILGFQGVSRMDLSPSFDEEKVNSQNSRAIAYVSQSSLTIPFFVKPSETGQTSVPSSGFARIGGIEIIKYDSVTDLGAVAAGLKQLNVPNTDGRGTMGTVGREHRPTLEGGWNTAAELTEIEFGVGFDNVNPIEAILQLAVSTGNSGHHSSYDVLAEGVSPPLNPLHFDLNQMQGKADSMIGSPSRINYFMGGETTKLHELAAGWLQPFGMYLSGRVTDNGEYRIQVLENLPPLEAASATELGTSQLSISDPGEWRDGSYRIVTDIEFHYNWDNLNDQHNERAVLNIHTQSPTAERHKVTWKPVGVTLSTGQAENDGLNLVLEILARYSRAYDLFAIRTDRTGWNLHPGDIVSLTIPSAPTTSGSRGYEDRKAVVLQGEHIYHDPNGRLGSTLLVVVEGEFRFSSYAPAATIASYDGGAPSITLDATSEWTATGDTQAAHFDDGDVVVIIRNRGDWSQTDTRTLSNKSGNTFDIDTTLPWSITADTIMLPADYTTAQASQRKHAHIADNSLVPVLSGPGNTESFKYV